MIGAYIAYRIAKPFLREGWAKRQELAHQQKIDRATTRAAERASQARLRSTSQAPGDRFTEGDHERARRAGQAAMENVATGKLDRGRWDRR